MHEAEQVSTEGLNTETKRAGNQGANALIEGSDITDESVESVCRHSPNEPAVMCSLSAACEASYSTVMTQGGKSECAARAIAFPSSNQALAAQILDKLKNKVLPESKAMIAKASDDGSTYTASLAKACRLVYIAMIWTVHILRTRPSAWEILVLLICGALQHGQNHLLILEREQSPSEAQDVRRRLS